MLNASPELVRPSRETYSTWQYIISQRLEPGWEPARWGRRARLWLVARVFWVPGLDPSTLACDDCLLERG